MVDMPSASGGLGGSFETRAASQTGINLVLEGAFSAEVVITRIQGGS